MLLLRTLKPELLEVFIKEYVRISIGEYYLDFPGFDLKVAMKDSSQFTPILLILKSGADPSSNLQALLQDYEKDLT